MTLDCFGSINDKIDNRYVIRDKQNTFNYFDSINLNFKLLLTSYYLVLDCFELNVCCLYSVQFKNPHKHKYFTF